MDAKLVEMRKVAVEAEKTMKKLCSKIGNIVAPECPVAQDEVRTFHCFPADFLKRGLIVFLGT